MDNEIYDEISRITQRIKQIEDTYFGPGFTGEGDKFETKALPPEERKELEQLRARLQELKKRMINL